MSTDEITLSTAQPTPSRRLPSLTGLRGIAALLVFATHATKYLAGTPAGPEIATVAAIGGYAGLSFFFMLSGFVLTWSMRTGDTAPKFWRRRFFKIYPNHLVTFLIALALMWATGGPVFGALLHLFLFQAWTTDLTVVFGINGVSWSLSVEALLYLSFPLLVWLIGRIRPARLWFWAAGVVAAIVCVPLLARLLPDQPVLPWDPSMPALRYWFIDVFPPVRLLDFALGILLARIVVSAKPPRIRLWWAAIACVAGYAVATVVPLDFAITAVMAVPLAMLVLAAASTDVDSRPSWLGSRVGVWLGDTSFAFYLLHGLVLYSVYLVYGPGRLPGTLDWVVLTAVALAVSFLLSWGLHRLVELPVQRRFSVRRRK